MKTLYRCVGTVAAQRERAKEAKHGAKARAVGHRFFPCGFESYVAWGPSSVKLLGLVTAHAESVHAENTTGVTGWSARTLPRWLGSGCRWRWWSSIVSPSRVCIGRAPCVHEGKNRLLQRHASVNF